MSFEDWVKSLGLDPATLAPELLAILQTQYAASNPAPVVDTAAVTTDPMVAPAAAKPVAAGMQSVVADNNKIIAANMRRVAAIQAKAKDHPMIAAKAIEEGWDEYRTEVEVLKAGSRSTGPSHRPVEEPPVPLVLEAALAMSRKIPNYEKQYSDQILQAAHTQFRGRIGLQQMILIAASVAGYRAGMGPRITAGNLKTILAHAFPREPQVLQAGFSTASVPGILSNIANKELLVGYMEEDQTWREVAAIKSVSDFKTVTSYRLLDDMEYEELGAAGEIKHGKIGEESYTRSADTYAKMFTLTRKNIINDDLGAFDDLRNRVGRGGAKKLNRLFWTAFNNNSTFFTSARGNYIEGATTNLGVDGVGLGLALDAFDAMRSPSADGSKVLGGLVGGSPTILLTPGGAVARNAELLYTNSNLGNGTKNSDANIYSGRYKPVKSVFLNDPTITGYSTTAWYLLRDPAFGAVVCVSFLDGVETPTVESADADFDTLGIQFRGYHDFGVDQAEYLAGVKSKGAA